MQSKEKQNKQKKTNANFFIQRTETSEQHINLHRKIENNNIENKAMNNKKKKKKQTTKKNTVNITFCALQQHIAEAAVKMKCKNASN